MRKVTRFHTGRLPMLVGLGLLMVSAASAHHSTAVNYNRDSIISVEGVVTSYKFQNPHIQIRLDVANEAGETEVWLVELSAKNQYVRSGWTGEEFVAGQRITVSGWEGYRGRTMFMRKAIMPDGSEIEAGLTLPER